MNDPIATDGEPALTILAGDPDALPILKLMIARAHSRRDHERAATMIVWRDEFRKWINDHRLRQAEAQAIVDEADAKPGVETDAEEKETSPPVLGDSPLQPIS